MPHASYPGLDTRYPEPLDWPDQYDPRLERPYSPAYRESHPAGRNPRRPGYYPPEHEPHWHDRPPPQAGFRGPAAHPDDGWYPTYDNGPPRQPSPRRRPALDAKGMQQRKERRVRPRSSQPPALEPVPGAGVIMDEVKVTRKAVGAILGMKGARVRALRAETGASIHIRPLSDGAETTVVELKGTPEQVRVPQRWRLIVVKAQEGGLKRVLHRSLS